MEKYLRQCVDSIIGQTYPNIRIILVDDGSTDSSGQICDEYARIDQRITVIHKPNGGLSDARNAGLAQADTKYIYFLDSDDYIEPQTIEILRAYSEQNNLDVLTFDVNEIINEGSERVGNYDYWVTKGSYPDIMKGYELLAELLRNGGYKAPAPLHFYRREFLAENGITFKKGIIHEDELFTFIALLHAERVAHIPARLYDRRVRDDSITTTKFTQRNSDSMYIILREALETYGKFRDDPETKAAYDRGIMYLTGSYFNRYRLAFDVQDENGRRQFREITAILKSLGYDISGYVGIKPALKKIPGLQPCYSLAKRAAKKVIRHFIPKIDDECREILARLRNTNKPGTKRIIILCVPRHGNRGDIAISLAERELLTRNFPGHVLIELPGDFCASYSHLITKNLNSRDILMTNGGGYFGSLWRNEMLNALKITSNFPHNRIIIMPQTWYYFDNEQGRNELEYDRVAFAKFTDLHVFARDRNSYELIHRDNLYPNAKSVNHVPDMVLSMDFMNLAPEKRSGVLVCLRPDPEKVMGNQQQNEIYARLLRDFARVGFFSTNPAQSPVKIHDWEEALNDLLKRVAGAELVVTDRLHGMIFAAITGTPCVAFDNRTGKVHSVHEWISDCEYIQICGGLDEFGGAVKKALSVPHVWDNSGLVGHFRKITDLITEKD